MLEKGQQAPEFEVKDHNGNVVRLSDYRGRNVVLWFYPRADTPGWTKEGCGFRDNLSRFENKNTQILGISFDGEADNRAFAEKFHFNFPLLCDTTREIGMAYGACENEKAEYAKRISYVIGPDGVILQAYPNVAPAKHPEEILKSLES